MVIQMQRSFIKHKILSKSDLLVVERITEWYLPKEKFVRRMDKVQKREAELIATYKIDVPFTITEVRRKSVKMASHYFQTDDMYITREWVEKVKTYQEPELSLFIEKIMNAQTTPPTKL